ncbi:hypothetical protein [Caenimonas soli]|uniref:hypothetical protein n=1 Tax=Caenimonas soli TaxID=2735555 RepID=UPI0015521CB5|nr:hypothetical protein [Caenimonas soli]NPC59201.1 hypothetical protein [Caenimonas soli]
MTFIRALWSLPAATLPCFVAAVVFSTVAMANVPSMGWWQGAVAAEAPAVSVPFPEVATAARARAVCESCGVVETIRRFEPVGELPAGYELTVRMRDGSTRVSSLANAAKWHTGDRIMLIGGAPASAKQLP